MLTLTSEQQTALAQRQVMRRDFIWCEARDPITGDPDPAGFWNDVGNVLLEGRTYHGSGLFNISTLQARSDLSIPGLTITLSGIDNNVAAMVRGLSMRQAPIEVYIGIFDVSNSALIGSIIKRFSGKVDDIEIITPPASGKSTITITCESSSRALTIKRTETRSQASIQERNPGDAFFDYTTGQSQQPLYFGRAAPGVVAPTKARLPIVGAFGGSI